MADKIINIKFKVDTSDLKAFSELTRQMNSAENSSKSLNNSLERETRAHLELGKATEKRIGVLGKGLDIDRKAEEYTNKYAEELRKSAGIMTLMEQATKKQSSSQEKLSSEMKKGNTYIANSSGKLEKLGNEAKQASNSTDKLGNEMQQTAKQTETAGNTAKKAGERFQGMHESMKGLNKYQLSFGDATRIATERMIQWATASNLIYGAKRAVSALAETVVELDSQLIEMQKVMPDDTDFGAVFESANKTAQEFGKTLTEINEAYVNFGQMGYNEKQMEQMAKATAVFSNVGGLTMDEASETLISTLNAYGYETEKAMKIVDMFNTTQNKFAVGMDDLSESFKRAGATANTFGVSVETLIGHTTAIKEVTRSSGSEIGNALKTIYSRITTMDDAYSELKAVGVDSFNAQTGAIRPVEDILNDLSGVWGNLTDGQKQQLAVTIAGRQQLSKFIALMDNYKTATSSASNSSESWGSAMEENKKQAEGLEFKINNLKSSLQLMADAIGKSGFKNVFGGGLEMITTMIQGATSAIKDFGSVTVTSVLGASGVIGKLILNYKTLGKNLGTSMADSYAMVKNFANSGLGGLAQSISNVTGIGMQSFAKMDTVIRSALNTAKGFITAVLTNPFTWIAVVITGFTLIRGEMEKVKQQQKELADTAKTAKEEMADFGKSISNGSVGDYDINKYKTINDELKSTLKETSKIMADFGESKAKIEKGIAERVEAGGLSDASGIRGLRQVQKITEGNYDLSKSLEDNAKKYGENAKAMDVLSMEQLKAFANAGIVIDAETKMGELTKESALQYELLSDRIAQAEQAMIDQAKNGLMPTIEEFGSLDEAITSTSNSLETYAELLTGYSSGVLSNTVQESNAYYLLLEKQRKGIELTALETDTLNQVEKNLAKNLGLSKEALAENEKTVTALTQSRYEEQQALDKYLQSGEEEDKQAYETAQKKTQELEKRLENVMAIENEAEAKETLAQAGITTENTNTEKYEQLMDRRISAIERLREEHGTQWDLMEEKEKQSLISLEEQELAYENYLENYANGDKVQAEFTAKKLARLYEEEEQFENMKNGVSDYVSETSKKYAEEAQVAEEAKARIETANNEVKKSQEELTTAVNDSSTAIQGSMSTLTTTLNDVATEIDGAISNIEKAFKISSDNIGSTVKTINKKLSTIGDTSKKLNTTISNNSKKISSNLNKIYSNSKDKLDKLKEKFNKVKDAFNKLKNAVESHRSISSNLNAIYNNSKDNLTKVRDKLIGIKNAWESVKETIDDQTVKGTIKIDIGFGGLADGNGGIDASKLQQEAFGAIGTTSISGKGFGGLRQTSGYGRRIDPITGRAGAFHDGIDLAGAMGTPIRARKGGRVVYAGWLGGYGNYVKIASGNGLETFYGHMSAIAVKTGQVVPAGMLIGAIGSTGRSTGPHLHFGAHLNGSSINPTPFYHQGGIVTKKPRQNEVDTRLQVGEMVLTQRQQKQMFDILNERNSNRNGRGIQESGGGYSDPSIGLGMGGIYTVQRGDTLSEIAKKYYGNAYSGGLKSLLSLNPSITNANKIYVGQRINVPDKGTSTQKTTSSSSSSKPKVVTPQRPTRVYDAEKSSELISELEKTISYKGSVLGGYYETPQFKWSAMRWNRNYYQGADLESKRKYNTELLSALSEYTNLNQAYKNYIDSGFFFNTKEEWAKGWEKVSKSIIENAMKEAEESASAWLTTFDGKVKEASASVKALLDAWNNVADRKLNEQHDNYIENYVQKLLESQNLSFAVMSQEEKLEKKLTALQNKIESRAEENAELQYRLLSEQLNPRLKELQGYINDVNKEIWQVTANLKYNGITGTSYVNKVTAPLKERLKELTDEYSELQGAISGANSQISTNEAEIKDLVEEYKKIEAELNNLSSKRDFTDIWGNIVYSTDGAVTQITADGQLIMNTLANVKKAISEVSNNADISELLGKLDKVVTDVNNKEFTVTSKNNSSSSTNSETKTYETDTNVIRNVTYVVQTGVALASESELKEFAMVLARMIEEEKGRGNS